LKRKFFLLFTLIFTIVLTSLSSLSVSASWRNGIIYEWYSDENEIRKWENGRPTIWAGNLGTGGFTNTEFNSYVTHGRSQWTAAGIPTTLVTSDGANANIRIYGGTYSVLKSIYTWLDSDVNGTAVYTGGATFLGTLKYGSTYKNMYYANPPVNVYVISKNRTADQYKKTFTHEIGHALGWKGHSPHPSDIMYHAGSSVTGLTFRDKNHLKQVYD
jgi:hypothetical protein